MIDEWLEIGKKKKDEGWVSILKASSLYRVFFENDYVFRYFQMKEIFTVVLFYNRSIDFYAKQSLNIFDFMFQILFYIGVSNHELALIWKYVLDTGISYFCLCSLLNCIRSNVILFAVLALILPKNEASVSVVVRL